MMHNEPCSKCPVKNFVHHELYCSQCASKPAVSGEIYLFMRGQLAPLKSKRVRASSFLAATHEVMEEFRIEFIEDDL